MTNSNYLVHDGIPGMHWGKRNGPPYPLKYDKLSAEEKQKAKDATIRKGDIQTAYRNRDHYTDQELKAVKERFKLNQEVAAIDRSLIKTGADKVDRYLKKAEFAFNTVDRVGKMYNIGLKVANTFGYGTELNKYDFNLKSDKDKNNNNNNKK